MKNVKFRPLIYAICGVSVILWWILLSLTGTSLNSIWNALKLVPNVITIDFILWWIFIFYAWKWRIFKSWLVPFPCLQGTWEGFIQTTWKDSVAGIAPNKIPVILAIKQSYLSISCTMFSNEMTSKSKIAEFIVDSDSNTKQIVYVYTSVPRTIIRGRSPIHDGTVVLDVIDVPNKMLKGEYWTNRETIGEIELRYKCKEIAQKFEAS